MRLTENQLRKVIRKVLLSEMDWGMMPGHDPRATGAESFFSEERIASIIETDAIPNLIASKWNQISDKIVEHILEEAINYDANVFVQGAQEGDEDRAAGMDHNPDEHLRHGVMFQQNMDYVMGYEWGYENGDNWDGESIPDEVMDRFINDKIESYKGRAKSEITKDAIFHFYNAVAPNRIIKKVFLQIKDMYDENGFSSDLVKFAAKLIVLVGVVECIDLFVIPMVAAHFGIPLPPGVVGIGEFVLPIALPMLGAKLAQDFVEKYQERSGNEHLHDDIFV